MVIKLIGAFLAEIGFGVLFNIHGKKLLAAALTGTLGSLIYEYYTMLAIIQGNTMSALEIGIHTLGCAGALALGIALTSAFFSLSMKKS